MNRNMRRSAPSGGPYGPLATNHIRNLNEELENLQRRRELLQREQELLSAEHMYGRKRQYENNQPSKKFTTFDRFHQPTQNFSHLYDNGPESSFDRGGPQPNKKSHTINVWDNDRLNPNLNQNNQRFGPYVGPKPQPMGPPKPLMSIVPKPSIGRRISGFPSQKARKDFIPNKVTKPHKLNPHKATKPSPGTSTPLQKALQGVTKSPTNSTKGSEILRPDRVPSQQMTGRLELALGAILKEMKQDYCTNEESLSLFHSKNIQRSIKQSIRERLRTVMLNKVVGRYVDIVATYRETYPAKTDKEIVDTAILSTGPAERHMRYNINRILTKKLDEMFTKLQHLYEGKEEEVQKLIESSPIDINIKQQEKTETTKKVEREFYNSLIESLLETKLPKFLPNYIDRIIKILEQDEEVKNIKQLKGKFQQRTRKSKDQSVPIEVNDSETENDATTLQETDTKEASLEEGSSKDEINKDFEAAKNKQNELTNGDETLAKPDKIQPTGEIITNKEINAQESVETQNVKPTTVTQYFVKVIGQPSLPNRNDAYKFLNQFNAVSIKKHKLVQNLLVVGFNNEKDFENAIAGSGTVVGNSTLTIKANEKQQLSTPMPSSKEEGTDNTELSKNILTSDIEHQISDLLSSIRKEEEDKSEKEIKTEDTTNITSDNSQQPNIKKENMAVDDSKEGSKLLEGPLQNIYSPSNPYDEDSEGLETIQEKNPKIENEEVSNNAATEGPEVQSDDSNKNIKINNTNEVGKGTPVRTSSRLSNVTASTIRTRRASRLAQNN